MRLPSRKAPQRQRVLSLLAVLIALVLVVPLATLGHHRPGHGKGPPIDPPGHLLNIQMLAINDYHGHLEPNTPGTAAGVPAGGAEFLATHLELLRQGKKHSLTVAAGDLIGGTPFLSGLFHDEPSVESLNAMELDVSSVGNHEFDHGVDELLRHQHGGCHPVSGCFFPDDPYEGADFPWLAANVSNASTGATVLPPYWIKQFENVKVGFIGMTLEGTPTLVAQAGIQGWNFADEAETANALVPELQAQGVEAIVVLLHEGGIPTTISDIDGCVGISGPIVDIQNNLDPAIDVLITGHTHLPYNCVMTDPDGNPRTVTSAFAFGRVISEVNLVVNRRTGDVRRDLVTATNHVVHQSVDPHPDLTAVLNKWRPLAQDLGNQPVGQITADITRAGGAADDRSSESDLGNMIADAQLWATTFNGAQIAFMNPGGMRADLIYASSPVGEGDGVVTYGEAFNVQPFANLLTTIPMTGAQVVEVLEEQCQPAGSSRAFLHLGVSEGFSYDLSRTIGGGNCTSVSISNVQLNGVALDTSATYQVTVNNFLVDGGDNFGTFAEVPVGQRVGAGIDLNALIAYLDEEGPIEPPGTNRVNEAF